MLGRKLGLVVIAVALALTPLSAGAQMNPRSKPTTVGPLTFDGNTYAGRNCKDGQFRRNGDTGRVTSKWTFCTFFYRYSTAQDNNSNRDFGAMWLSTRANPTNGWCARRVISQLGVQTSGTGKVLKRAPQGSRLGANRSRKVQTRLVVNAGGSATTQSVLKKNWTLHRGEVDIRKFKRDGFTNLQLDYKGPTKKTAAFGAAFEMSWPQGQNPPSIFPELRVLHAKPCSN
ncbi:hypothetical protein BH20ACT23_BH20ACT23_17360 [soil metagenome]